MKKIVLGFTVLLFLAAGAAALYVANIDWNQHKDKIAEQFYNVTGKEISFDGRIGFRIFPTPYLNAVNVKIYNGEQRNKPLLDIKNMVAELAFGPLLKGEFDIKRMILDGAVINFEWTEEGLNWQSNLTPDQRQMMEDSRMVLNSVSLKNAEVNFEMPESGTAFTLTNLNGEVSAQSVFGPFRIEGTYLKGNSPEAFAMSVGKLSDSFATTLNAVVSHPMSNSYVRYDGSFHLINKVLNGNVIVESKNLSDFINNNLSENKLPAEYNQPLALGFDIALNPQNLNLSNIVVKYGGTQGAGTLQMPIGNTQVPEITTSFNFTDLELDPLVKLVRQFVDKYKEDVYTPNYQVDLTAEFQAVRASYLGQGLKNLVTELTLDNDTLSIDNFSVVLPGDTNFKLNGSVYPYEDEVYYQANISVSSDDLIRTLKWLNIEPKANAASVYKKMLATLQIAGNFDKVQISPYKITLDKSTVSGEAGIVLGDKKDIMLVANADTINFDNYIGSLPEEEKNKSWAERMAYRFGKLDILNSVDLVLNAKADLIIYESMPFEKVDVKGNVLNGVMEIEYAKTEQVANTTVGLKGNLSGFGNIPQMDNLQYEIKSRDIASLINKLELKVPDFDYKKLNTLTMMGTINGSSENFGINTTLELGNMALSYIGSVKKENDLMHYNGDLEVKHPDLIKLLTAVKAKYQPEAKNLGIFRAKGKVSGTKEAFNVENLDANIGYTAISGYFNYDETSERPNIISELKINKLEVEKFLQDTKGGKIINGQDQPEAATFLDKPFWSKEKINYSPYIGFDANCKFSVQELSYNTYLVKEAEFALELVDGTASFTGVSGIYNKAPFTGEASLRMIDAPLFSGNVKIDEAQVNDFILGGRKYHLKGGKFSTRFDFNSKADSEQSFIDNLKGKAEFSATATEVGGINLIEIYNDLLKRETSSGLAEAVKTHLDSGKTLFDKLSGRIIVDQGAFSLADSSMQANNVDVKVYGEGNLGDWDMNTVFNVKYAEPKYLPEFSFSLKNSMANPTVDVNVSSLFKMYQAKEEQKEVAKAAEVEAEKSYWAELVQEQKKTADDLVASTRGKLEKDVEAKMAAAVNPQNVNKYNALKQEIAKVLAGLVEVMDNFDTETADNDGVQKLKDANGEALRKIESFAQQRDEIYLAELKKQNETDYNKIVDMHNLLKQSVFAYNALLDKFNERMAKIMTDYELDKDEQFLENKAKIDAAIEKLEALNGEAEQAQKLQKAEASIAEYEEYNKKLSDIYQSLKSGRDELAVETETLQKQTTPKIDAAEKAYLSEIEAEENRRRLEENTGSISIKKTGRTVTVTRDIEEIKEAEKEISKEGVKVLDFSREKILVDRPVQNTNENVIKKGRNIRPN